MKNEQITKGKAPITKIFAASLAALLLVFASCSNILEPPRDTDTGEGEGLFSLSIASGQTGRTILPTQNEIWNIGVFALRFTSAGKDPVSADRTPENLNELLSLAAGTWSVEVTAYRDSEKTKPTAKGSVHGIEIIPGETAKEVVALEPFVTPGEQGIYTWTIDYPENVTSASMRIKPLDPATGTPEDTYYFIDGGNHGTWIEKSDEVELNTGYYRVTFTLYNGEHTTVLEEYLHIYSNMTSLFEYDFTADHFTVSRVTSEADSGPGSLRQAIENAVPNSTIEIDSSVGTIELESNLYIDKSLTILGKGVTITPAPSWTQDDNMLSSRQGAFVTIARVHFKGGKYRSAIYNDGELRLESCILSGNSAGAIDNWTTLTVVGCTFYGNSADNASGVIYNQEGNLTLTGNLFYGSTNYDWPVVDNWNGVGSVTSAYNVVDVPLGTGIGESGWTPDNTTDKYITGIPISGRTFRLLSGSEAANVITTKPADYPTEDFYGNTIVYPAAAGAVQESATGSGYYVELKVNNTEAGSVNIPAAPDEDGLYPASITLTATPIGDSIFSHWLVNGSVDSEESATLTITLTNHTRVEAVLSRVVTVNNEASLRSAVENVLDADIIRISGVNPGQTVIELSQPLSINNDVTIEGNGITLSPGASFPEYSSLLDSMFGVDVIVKRVHFKGSKAGVIGNFGNMTVESCIFSDNDNISYISGGIIYNSGAMTVKGSTFYGNNNMIANHGDLTLTGNLFYGNTGSLLVTNWNQGVTSGTYNVVDVTVGTAIGESGWTAGTGDETITGIPISGKTFRLLSGSKAANVITSRPAEYPTEDFYGNTIEDGAAAGAVQETTNGSGFYVEFRVDDTHADRVNFSSDNNPDGDGLYPDSTHITVSVSPSDASPFAHWLVNGSRNPTNPMIITPSAHIKIEAVFSRIVSVHDEESLRIAVSNALDGDIISIGGLPMGITIIELPYQLYIEKSIIIEGNGVTLSPSASLQEGAPLLQSTAGTDVTVKHIHFKDNDSKAIANYGNLTVESCIFSGNRGINGAAIGNNIETGSLTVKGSTFYGNSVEESGGAIYNRGDLTLTGNLFYGNTADLYLPVLSNSGNDIISSYNVVDVPFGNGSGESGWTAGTGDKTLLNDGDGLTIEDVPFTTTFFPVYGLHGHIPEDVLAAEFTTTDFYGHQRTRGAPGAVDQ